MLTVFQNKKCTVEIKNPQFGQTGFRKKDSGEIEQVFYDKGGSERTSWQEGKVFSVRQAGWVCLEEFRQRKEARARAWRKSREGQNDYLNRQNSAQSRDGRFERLYPYGGEHPHAWA